MKVTLPLTYHAGIVDGDAADRAGAAEIAAIDRDDRGQCAVHDQAARVHRRYAVESGGAGQRPDGVAVLFQLLELVILQAGAESAEVERGAANAAEVQRVGTAPAANIPGDRRARSEAEQIIAPIQLDRSAAAARDGAGVEDGVAAGRALDGDEEAAGDRAAIDECIAAGDELHAGMAAADRSAVIDEDGIAARRPADPKSRRVCSSADCGPANVDEIVVRIVDDDRRLGIARTLRDPTGRDRHIVVDRSVGEQNRSAVGRGCRLIVDGDMRADGAVENDRRYACARQQRCRRAVADVDLDVAAAGGVDVIGVADAGAGRHVARIERADRAGAGHGAGGESLTGDHDKKRDQRQRGGDEQLVAQGRGPCGAMCAGRYSIRHRRFPHSSTIASGDVVAILGAVRNALWRKAQDAGLRHPCCGDATDCAASGAARRHGKWTKAQIQLA
ncbi:hypothetical protein [Bradyrhizobium sp. USDA 241]|uniref:hypothetical protein n=1 Tax=Bradyrhizobium sp. USDA 241 TaxID=3377725 RepID=UPI003C7799A3